MISDAELRAQARKSLRTNPPPILLSKAEALDFAAQQLDRNASQLRLVVQLVDAIGSTPGDAERDTLIAEIRRHAVEPDLQLTAMKAAADAIRDLAIEERVVAARVAAGARSAGR